MCDPGPRRMRRGLHTSHEGLPWSGCTSSASSPAWTSMPDASSRASNSSTSATPEILSSWQLTMTARVPTSSCSWTSPQPTRSATRSPSSPAAPPMRCSCPSPSAAASARWPMPRPCSTRAPTRSRSTPPPSQRPELLDELADVFGAQCVVLAIDAKAVRPQRAPPKTRQPTLGGLPRRRAHLHRPRRGRVGPRGRRAGRGGDPADEHGPRRHQRRLRPAPSRLP